MQFGAPHILLLLLPLVLLWSLGVWLSRRRRSNFAALISPRLEGLLSTRKVRMPQPYRLHLHALAAALLLLALARPQWGYQWKDRSRSGIDLVVVVDVSQSMLATDVPPTRLEQARREVMDLLRHLQGDRVGLVSFAGVAFTEVPLTLDYSAFELILNSLSPQLIPIGGTNIQAALHEAARVFGSASGPERAKAVLLITDGEEFDGSAATAMRALEGKGVRVYVLGIGTPEGAPIPTAQGHKRAKDGSVVISRLRPEVLRTLAEDSGGRYVQAVVSEADTRELYENGIQQQLEAKTIEWGSAKQWNEYYQVPLSIALLSLIIAWFPPSRRLEVSKRRSEFANLTAVCVLSLLLFPALEAFAANPEQLGEDARQALTDGRFEDAYEHFSRAHQADPRDPRFLIGKAASLYRQQRFEEALQTYLLAADQSENPLERAKQHYNAGNALVQLARYQEAIAQYELSLALVGDDSEARENLDYAKKLLEQQQEQQKQQENEEQQQDSKSQQSQTEKADQEQPSGAERSEQQNQQQNESKDSSGANDSAAGQRSEENEEQSQRAGSETDAGQEKPEHSEDNGEQQTHAGRQPAEKSPENDRPEGDKSESESETSTADPNAAAAQRAAGAEQDKRPTKDAGSGDDGDESEESAARLSSEDLMQLRSVEEQRGAQIRFRAQKAVHQLKELDLTMPENDW